MLVDLGHALGWGGNELGGRGREPGGDEPGDLGAFMGLAVSVGVFVEESHEMLPDPAGVVCGPEDGGVASVGWLVGAADDCGQDLGCFEGHLDDMLIAEHSCGPAWVAVEEKDIHGGQEACESQVKARSRLVV